MAEEAGGNEMESVKNYFNTAGFERWNKIYGTTSVRGALRRDVTRFARFSQQRMHPACARTRLQGRAPGVRAHAPRGWRAARAACSRSCRRCRCARFHRR
jgi:hypothetical protein